MRMKAVGFLLACLLAVSFPAAAFAYGVSVSNDLPAGNMYIPKGTVIEAEFVTSANSANNDANDIVYFKLRQNVAINGVVVLPRGTVGNAYVVHSQRGGFLGMSGQLELRVPSVQALNGATVPLTTDLTKYGTSSLDMSMAYVMYGLYNIGFHRMNTYLLLFHGADKEIRAGTRFTVMVDDDADLGCTADNLAIVMVKR